jgi:uncharacterized protein (DUF2252 family)
MHNIDNYAQPQEAEQMAEVVERTTKKRKPNPGVRDRFSDTYVPWVERWDAGKKLRDRVPRENHAGWDAPKNRPDPIDLLIKSDKGRLPELVPIRHGRMLTSAFAFLRGSAAVMACDLSQTPKTGIRIQACGDCHLMNFGAFATPERHLIFDINDFDETLPAPWEWDVKRLAASFAVAGKYINLNQSDIRAASESAVRSYRKSMARYSQMRVLDIWYDHVDLEQLIDGLPDPDWQRRWRQRIAKESTRSVIEHEYPKLAASKGKKPKIKDNPPLIYHLPDEGNNEYHQSATAAHYEYLESLAPHYRAIIERYKLTDIAVKVVGVGSVGTLCLIALLMASDDDLLFIQFKEADASVLEPYAGASEYKNHGQRVVVGQRYMQAASDMLLGWAHGKHRGRDFYARQLRDMKMSVTIEAMDKNTLKYYAKVCGHVLARAHARSADPALIAGYMGNSNVFDEAVAEFAVAYSAQTDRDHESLAGAVRDGRIEAESP